MDSVRQISARRTPVYITCIVFDGLMTGYLGKSRMFPDETDKVDGFAKNCEL